MDFSHYYLPNFIATGGGVHSPRQAVPESSTYIFVFIALLGLWVKAWYRHINDYNCPARVMEKMLRRNSKLWSVPSAVQLVRGDEYTQLT